MPLNEEEGDEIQSLVTSKKLSKSVVKPNSALNRTRSSSRFSCRYSILLLLIITASIALYLKKSNRSSIITSIHSYDALYSCPSEPIAKALNDKDGNFDTYQEDNDKKWQKGIEKIKNIQFDGWGESYNKHKKKLSRWKQRFTKYVNSGDWIYESACGEGLNILLTGEVLLENGIDNITIFGNDYLQESIDIAKKLFEVVEPGVVREGVLCQGDSTDLSFVPDNFFDLAFTGYIDPLQEPLDIARPESRRRKTMQNKNMDTKNNDDDGRKKKNNKNMNTKNSNDDDDNHDGDYGVNDDDDDDDDDDTDDDNNIDDDEDYYDDYDYNDYADDNNNGPKTTDELCNSDDWAEQQLAKIAQAAQEDWYASWVTELIRIVKPGKYVIVEHVSYPSCEQPKDWGGVSEEWWTQAVSRYSWEVDVDSIEINSIGVGSISRYNVVMKKLS